MTPVKVWQERVEIPTYETGPQDIHPMFLDRPARFIPTA